MTWSTRVKKTDAITRIFQAQTYTFRCKREYRRIPGLSMTWYSVTEIIPWDLHNKPHPIPPRPEIRYDNFIYTQFFHELYVADTRSVSGGCMWRWPNWKLKVSQNFNSQLRNNPSFYLKLLTKFMADTWKMGYTMLLCHLTWYIASWKPVHHLLLYRIEKPEWGNVLHTEKNTVPELQWVPPGRKRACSRSSCF